MQQLLYVSVVHHVLNPQAVMQLVSRARCRNRHCGITGTLVSGAQHFFQLLEGDEAALDKVYGDIRHDPRHRAVLQLGRRDVDERLMPGEDMAYAWTDDDIEKSPLDVAVSRLLGAVENQRVGDALRLFARPDLLA